MIVVAIFGSDKLNEFLHLMWRRAAKPRDPPKTTGIV
jgi:hypothetical protein